MRFLCQYLELLDYHVFHPKLTVPFFYFLLNCNRTANLDKSVNDQVHQQTNDQFKVSKKKKAKVVQPDAGTVLKTKVKRSGKFIPLRVLGLPYSRLMIDSTTFRLTSIVFATGKEFASSLHCSTMRI